MATHINGDVRRRVSSCQGCGRAIVIAPMAKQKNEANKKRFTNSDQFVAICEACKKFYSRYRGKIDEEKCPCGDSDVDAKCRVCRYQRCKDAIAGAAQIQDNPSPEDKVDFFKLPCAVCGVSSSGFHFGVLSCEGCKGFFRRSVNRDFKIQYSCKAAKDGLNPVEGQLCPTFSSCRKCRLQRCVDAGMSLNEEANNGPAQSVRRRLKINATARKHSSEGRFLRKTKSSSTSRPLLGSSSDVSLSNDEGTLSKNGQSNNVEKTNPSDAADLGHFTKPYMLELARGYEEHVEKAGVNELLQRSNDWYVEQAVQASARLIGISKVHTFHNPETTPEQHVSAVVSAMDTYMKHVRNFIMALPGTNRISLADRTCLFVQGFYPIVAMQLSLDFDAQRQLPNHISLDREISWEISAKHFPTIHFTVESFLVEAGNRFTVAVNSLQEFALLCALLLLNPDTPNLENAELVRTLRHRYELALVHYCSKAVKSEQRLAELYQLLPFFRTATLIVKRALEDVNDNHPAYSQYFSPLFLHLESQISNLMVPSPSSMAASSST